MDFVRGGGRKSLKVLTACNNSKILAVFAIFLLNQTLNKSRATKRLRKIGVWGIKNHKSVAVRGGACPPGSASGICIRVRKKLCVALGLVHLYVCQEF